MAIINLGWLADLLSNIPFQDGLARAQRRVWNFVGVELVDDPTNARLDLTVTGDPDLPLAASTITANRLQSEPNERLEIEGQDGSSTSIRFFVAAVRALSIGDLSGASALLIPAARSGFALGWEGNAASGAGGDINLFGQAADTAGQRGGDINVETGAGGAGALAGDVDVNVGGAVSNVSASFKVRSSLQGLIEIAQRAASTVQLDLGSNSSLANGKIRALALDFIATLSGITYTIASGGTVTDQFAVAGNAQAKAIRGYGTQTTTTATTTTFTLYSPPNDVAVGFRAVIIGYETNAKVCTYHVEGTFRKAAGTVALVAKTPVHSGEDSAGYDGTLVASTSVIAAQVVTPDAVNVRWEVFWTACLGGAT